MTTLFINLLALGTLLSSIFSITSKNPVIAVIFLISSFVQAAGYLILIGVSYLGISYVIIYVGAIAVLFLFSVMLLKINISEITETQHQYTKNIPLAIFISFLFIYIFFTILPFSYNDISVLSNLLELTNNLNAFLFSSDPSAPINSFLASYYNPIIADSLIFNFTQISVVGHTLYTFYSVWLIITSIILLLALFSIIILNKN